MNLYTVYQEARTASYNVANPVRDYGWSQDQDGRPALEVYTDHGVTLTFTESAGVVKWEATADEEQLAQGATASRRELDKILRRDFRPIT